MTIWEAIATSELADTLGGSIRVESLPAKGTQVSDELPVVEREAEGIADLAHLVQELQELTRRRDELVEGAGNDRELEEVEDALERTHWRLARVAQRHATKTLGNAAAQRA